MAVPFAFRSRVITLHASGGWDPTELCDPKGGTVNGYRAKDIATTGAIRHAPHPGFAEFFARHRPLILNGIALSAAAHPLTPTPSPRPTSPPPHSATGREVATDSVERQLQLALAGARTTVHCGGFDTHANHDRMHIPRLTQLLSAIDFFWEEAARQQITDVILVVTSEMGRAPFYNDRGGKDHWPVTSAMVMGRGVPRNKVLGGTDRGFNALRVDPRTLEVSTAANAISLTLDWALARLG